MIAALVSTWFGLLLIGFALIYAAWIIQPGVFRQSDPAIPLGWGDAFYFSGVTLSTVGFGDEQPVHPLIRLVAVIESFSGVGVLSLSVAYVLEVYPILQRKAVLAVLLNEETGGQVAGLPLLARYLQVQNFEALADLLRTINLELLFLAEAHNRLPVLHYAPSGRSGAILLAGLAGRAEPGRGTALWDGRWPWSRLECGPPRAGTGG